MMGTVSHHRCGVVWVRARGGFLPQVMNSRPWIIDSGVPMPQPTALLNAEARVQPLYRRHGWIWAGEWGSAHSKATTTSPLAVHV